MYQIGIISKHSKRLIKIQAELNGHHNLESRVFLRAESLVENMEAHKIDGLIVCFEVFGMPQLSILKQIVDLYHGEIPVVAMAELVGPTARKNAEAIGAKIILKEMTEIEEVPGVVTKLIKGERVCPRAFSRFKAVQSLSLQTGKKGILKKKVKGGRLFNISQGGMRVRSFDSEFVVGDDLVVEVPGFRAGVSRKVKATVVWSERDSKSSQDLGLQFHS